MPSAQLAAATSQQQAAKPGAQQQRQAKPFCQASKVGSRLVGSVNFTAAAAPPAIGPFTLTASGGYVKRWILEVLGSGGGGTTTGVLQADAPWNLFALVTASEPNNNPIVNLSGYNLFLADIYGGYAGGVSPLNDPDYSADASHGANFQLWPYIPIELDPTGLGALSDISSSSGYQLYLLPNGDASVWSTLPSPLPAYAVNVYAEMWTLPEKTDGRGNPQAIVPPKAGTIQMWNQILNVVLAAGGGNQEMQLNRMGNQIRTLLMVTRAAGARSATPFPNPARIEWDDIILKGVSPYILRKLMNEKTGNDQQGAIQAGVYALFFNEGISRIVGGNGASSWLPTVTDTRFALSGQFGAASSPTLDWIVNDVSRAPLGAVERTTVGPSGPGYHPSLPTDQMPA